MTATFAFLRAINLGKNRQFPAADIRRVTESLGFTDVRTHAASGNLLFTTDGTVHQGSPRHDVETLLEAAFSADRGFEVPTIAFTKEQFLAVRDDALDRAAIELTAVPGSSAQPPAAMCQLSTFLPIAGVAREASVDSAG